MSSYLVESWQSATAVVTAVVLALGVTAYEARKTADLNLPESVVRLELPQKGGGYASCSGVIIDDPDKTDGDQLTILTAKHCVDEIGQKVKIGINLPWPESKQYRTDGIVYSISDKSDLALIQGLKADDEKNFSGSELTVGNEAFWGDPVCTVGYPKGYFYTLSCGYMGMLEDMSAYLDTSVSGEYNVTTAIVSGGSSGGPLVYKSWFGYVIVGIVTAGFNHPPFSSATTPVSEIKAYLESETRV